MDDGVVFIIHEFKYDKADGKATEDIVKVCSNIELAQQFLNACGQNFSDDYPITYFDQQDGLDSFDVDCGNVHYIYYITKHKVDA